MRVAVDYLPATTHWPGVGRYARELVRALVRLPDVPDLCLIEWGGEARAIGEPWLGLGSSRAWRRSLRAPRRALALSAALGFGADRWAGGADVFHRALPLWPPVSRARLVVPVAELPPEGSAAERALARELARASAVVVASAHCRAELTERLGIARERVHQVPTGCEHWRRELGVLPALASPPLIVVLGAVRPERRHAAILTAFEELQRRGEAGALALVGPAGPPAAGAADFERPLAASPARQRVRWMRAPIEPAMPALMGAASLLVHLSEREETPVTPLEAFSFGTPVLASRLPAFEEALGAEAAWVDAAEAERDPAELARAMAAAIATAGDRAARARREAIAARYTWAENARATLAVWRGLAAR